MRRKIYLILLIIVTIILGSIFVYGEKFFYAMKSHTYKETAGKINIVTEKNNDINNLNVYFENQGSCEVFIRGYVFVYIFDKEDEYNFKVVDNSSILISYSDKSEVIEDYWYKGEDNYIYYTKPLKIGEKTEKPFVKSIEINLSDKDKAYLEGKDIKVDIVVEAVQVNNDAYKYEWNIEDKNIESFFDKSSSPEVETFESEEGCKIIVGK